MKRFTIEIDDEGAVEYVNDGMADYEIIGVMQLIEADLRVRFASFSAKQRAEAKAAALVLEENAGTATTDG